MPEAAASPSRQSRILVVEDEHQVCELLSDIIGSGGYEPCCVQTDEDALKALVEARSFACMIVDVNLGAGLTGYDLARHARQRKPHLPVIYVSGQTSEDSYKANGVHGSLFVPKPFTPDELLEQIHKLVGDNDG